MNNFITIVFLYIVSMSGCASQKTVIKEAPMKVGQATCQKWLGGRAESGSGIILEVPMTSGVPENVVLKQAYFRGLIADIRMEKKEIGWVAKANLMERNAYKRDIIMDSDPRREIGNQPPSVKQEFPFELKPTECVLSYTQNGNLKYFKVANIKEGKPLLYQ